jgi:hypothetical protein
MGSRVTLNPLLLNALTILEWSKARVHLDYHVEVGHHFYSVPHRLVREQVDVRCTETTVECFFNGKRVASHEGRS